MVSAAITIVMPWANTSWQIGIGYLGPCENRKLEVPSDQIRKELMVSRLLDLIEMRAEYATERALH
jgi:hypothetical protein